MLPHIVFHGPEVCLAMGYPEYRYPCIIRYSLHEIVQPRPFFKQSRFKQRVLKELDLPGNPHHSAGTPG